MGQLKITDLVDEKEIEKVKDLADAIEVAKDKYVTAAKELAKGLTMKVDVVGDIDKINSILQVQAKSIRESGTELNDALKKQHELSEKVAKSLERMAKKRNLSAKEMKTLADASKKNAEALEREAKAEAKIEAERTKAQKSVKAAKVTEQERKKIILEAIELSKKEVHSIAEANEANKKLRQAVKLVKDTDVDYMNTLNKLNSTIGVNTDFVKRNSDRYTQQKMTVGDYKEQIKLAWMEMKNGNDKMKNMGIIAGRTGKILKTSMTEGLRSVGQSTMSMIKGFVGAQLVMRGIDMLTTKLKEGITVAMGFEEANSRLAAILGTTAKNTKDLQLQARELGATTKYTAAEATNLQIELAKLGFTTQEIKNATKYVLRFAQATGSELPEAAALTGAALRMFNADTKETERYVSAMAIATTKSALSFSYLATAMPIVGPVAKAFNFTIEDTLAMLGKLADSGFDASMAATATRNIFLNLADANGKLAKALGEPVKNLPDLVRGLQKLKEKGVDLNTTLELTDKRSVAAFNAFLTAADKIIPLREQVTGVEKGLEDMADEMTNNTAGAVKTLQSAWEELMITINGNTGAIRAFVEFCTEAVNGLRNLLTSREVIEERLTNDAINLGAEAGAEALEKQAKRIQKLKDENIKAGMDENKALEAAKAERLAILQKNLEKEKELTEKARKDVEKIKKEKEDASFWKQGLSLQKTDNEFDKAIADSFNKYTQQMAYVKSLEVQIAGIAQMKNPDKVKKSLIETDEQRDKRLKKQKEMAEMEIEAMEEGIDKQILAISTKYNQKAAAIKGNSERETALRIALGEKMQKEIADAVTSYDEKTEATNIRNRLKVVEKGTEEEMKLELRLLDLQNNEEMRKASERGEDTVLLEQRFQQERLDIMEKYAKAQSELIANNASAEQTVRDQEYMLEISALEKKHAKGLISIKEYEMQKLQITADYARKTSEAAIDALESQLSVQNLSPEERMSLEKKLADEKFKLIKQEADAEVEAIKKVDEIDKKSKKERMKNMQQWLQTASEAVGQIGAFVGAMYDGQMAKIDEEQDKNQEAHDKEIERIEHLAETGAISHEEAEARKRAAEAKTEAKEKELEKKRQSIAYKKAMWEKATSISQAGIATALAITRALPNLFLASLVGAMGAVQIATILATPIPKYKKGTKDHPGGKAIVGDGGVPELVLTDKGYWLTPAVPTLVDLPKHAQVVPDINIKDDIIKEIAYHGMSEKSSTTYVNDYSRLEKRVDVTNSLLAQSIKSNAILHADMNLTSYISRRL